MNNHCGPCAECTELQDSLVNSFQVTPLNENDSAPRHTLIYLCSNGDMFQAVPVQHCSEVLVRAIKEVEDVQVKVTEALSNLCAKLKDTPEPQLNQMVLSKTISQESLTSSKGYQPLKARSNSQRSLTYSPARSLDSLTASPRKYGISASLSKLKAKHSQNDDQCKSSAAKVKTT